MKISLKNLSYALALLATASGVALADEVTDWNRIMLDAGLADKTAPYIFPRVAAIVEASVYDAVNGIDRRFAPVHVTAHAPEEASRRAAAVEAAYVALVSLYPAQKSTFDAKLAQSLADIGNDSTEKKRSIASGIRWGSRVANMILAWRASDGFSAVYPPFTGGTEIGQWRPTPPAFAPGAGFQFAQMTPWVIHSPSQFRPPAPPDLTSAIYTADFDETKLRGRIDSAARTADETLAANFWQNATVTYLWNHLALELSGQRNLTLSENARLLAQLNVVMADAEIASWDAKYTYAFWRPVTAIPLAASDGNPATEEDAAWLPLIVTPAHPEYPSAHSTLSSSAAATLVHYFGDDIALIFDSNVMPGVLRTFFNFTSALDEIKNARINGGIHYRNSCNRGQELGAEVAKYSIAHSFKRARGEGDDRSDPGR